MTDVVIDVEMTGRSYHSMFAIGICVQKGASRESRETHVFYFPEVDEKYRSEDTMKWWKSDPLRKEFLESALEKGQKETRADSAKKIREVIDNLYKEDSELVFYSDFAPFDLGSVDAFLGDAGYLPMYLKDDSSYPCEMVDHTTFVKALAKMKPTASSSDAFEKLGIERMKMSKNHDPAVDVGLIMDDVQSIMKKLELE